MKKIMIVLMIISVLILSGCKEEAPETTDTVVEPSGPSDVEVYEQEAADVKEAKEVGVKEAGKEVNAEMQKLIDKSEKITSLRYNYDEFIAGTTGYFAKVLLKGNKMRQEIKPGTGAYSGIFKPGERFDTVYFDLSSGKTKAYCEKATNCETEDMDKEVDVSDRNFITETPFDVLEEVKYSEIVRDEMIEGKNAKVADIKLSDGTVKRIWLWEYRGIPLQYEIYAKGEVGTEKLKRVVFGSLTINDVSEDELVHS